MCGEQGGSTEQLRAIAQLSLLDQNRSLTEAQMHWFLKNAVVDASALYVALSV
jgi:hypothetical protein